MRIIPSSLVAAELIDFGFIYSEIFIIFVKITIATSTADIFVVLTLYLLDKVVYN
jgi:hypothetical protein